MAPGENIQAGDLVSFVDGAVRAGTGRLPAMKSLFRASYSFNTFDDLSVVALGPNEFVVAYGEERTGGVQGYARVGTVVGDAIVYGPQIAFSSPGLSDLAMTQLSDSRIAIAFQENFGRVRFGEIDEDTLHFEEKFTFSPGVASDLDVAGLGSTRCVISFVDDSDDCKGKAVVVGIGLLDTLEAGPAEIFNNTVTIAPKVTSIGADSSDGPQLPTLPLRCFLLDSLSPTFLNAYLKVGETSGLLNPTVIAFGPVTPSTGNQSRIGKNRSTFREQVSDQSVGARRVWNLEIHRALVPVGGFLVRADVVGNSFHFGIPAFFPERPFFLTDVAGISSDQAIVAYLDISAATDSISKSPEPELNTVADWGPLSTARVNSARPSLFREHRNSAPALAGLSRNQAILGTNSFDLGPGSARLVKVGSLFRTVGIATANAAGGETVPVTIPGLSSAHSGLVPGQFYYAKEDGSLTPLSTDVPVGLAVSSSEIVLTGGVYGN